MDTQTRTLPPQIRLATLQPGTFNREARTVEVVWTTGARVRRYNWWEDEYYDEELEVSDGAVDMARLGTGSAPVLNSHKTYGLENQIGVVERAWIAGQEGRALLRLSAREELAGIVADIEAGIIRNISVGYSVQRYEVTREQGQVPVYRAVRWTPAELSFVTVPADAQAGTRDAPQQGGSPCQIIDPKETKMDRNDPAATAEPAADPAATAAPAAAPSASGEDVAARAADILSLATRHGLTDQAEGWIRSNKSIEAVRAEILDALAARSAQHDIVNRSSVMPGLDHEDKQRAAAEEMLLARGFCSDEQGKRIVMARDNPFRGYSLMDLARSALARAGVRTEGLTKLELVARAFTQTSSDFPTLLENVMHKALQGAYVTAADTWSRWCARGTVSDFRAHNRYRVGSLSNLDPLNESGEFVNKTIPDGEKSQITANTKGNIINLTRKAIINEDLGAFLGLAQAFGRAAARTVEADAYALLLSNPVMSDGFALFSAQHGNLPTAAAPSVASFDAARVLMGAQKDVGGNDFLSLTPAIWLGPLGLGGEARVINDSGFDPDAPNKLQRANKVRGLVRDIVDTPRLTGTGWYMFADPNEAPVIEVAFLDGQDTPFLDSEDGFGVDGVRWKCRLDFATGAIDYRGATYNAGQAPGG